MIQSLSFRSLSVFVFGCVLVGCECPEGEAQPSEACDTLVRAINEARASCGLDTLSKAEVCGEQVCDTGLVCESREDLDQCVSDIESLSCDALAVNSERDFSSCVGVYFTLEESCGDDDDDWDDDDWD